MPPTKPERSSARISDCEPFRCTRVVEHHTRVQRPTADLISPVRAPESGGGAGRREPFRCETLCARGKAPRRPAEVGRDAGLGPGRSQAQAPAAA